MDGPVILLSQWWHKNNTTLIFNAIIFFSIVLFLSFLYLLTNTSKLIFKNSENRNVSPPSPPKLPIIGNLHQLGGLVVRTLQSLSEKYGPLITVHFGHVPILLVSSVEVAQEILKTNDIVFSNRPQSRATDTFFIGSADIVFSRYGEHWRQLKKICVLQLLSQKRVHKLHSVRDEQVEKVKISCLNRAEINLSETFLTISSNIVSKSVIGDELKSYGGLLISVIGLMGEFCFKDLYPGFGWLDHMTGLVRKFKTTSKELHEFLDQVIDQHQLSNRENSDHVVDILLHLQKEGLLNIDLTRQDLKAILLDLIFGGTDTTETAMEWVMANLAKNPSVMKKAQEEVRGIVGKKSKVTESDIKQMVYLKWIVKESLESSENVKLKGYDIPAKSRVIINTWAIQRDPQVWDRAEEFIPERFGNTSRDFKGRHIEFITFGFGRRLCPGTEFVLANLLYWFDWELPNGQTVEDFDMDEVNQLVLRKNTPIFLVPVCHFPPNN